MMDPDRLFPADPATRAIAREFRSTSSWPRGTRMSPPTCPLTGSPTAPCTTG